MQFMQFMQESQNKFMQELLTQVAPTRGPEVREANLSEFLKTKPLPFATAPEPLDADDWFMDTERKLLAINAKDEEKVCFATHLLTGAAAAWWENQLIQKLPEKVITLQEFKEMFREFHVPESIMEMKRREFEDLQQGSFQMVRYINEFNKLSRYAADEVDTYKKRMKRFLKGLDPYAAMQLKMSKPSTFQELMNTAITWENDYKLVQQNWQIGRASCRERVCLYV